MDNDVFLLDPWHDIGMQKPISVPGVLQSIVAICDTIPDELSDEEKLYAFSNSCGLRLADADVEEALIWPNRRFASRAWLKDQYAKFVLFAMENHWLDGHIEARKEWPFAVQKGTLPLPAEPTVAPVELGGDLFPVPGVDMLPQTMNSLETDADGKPIIRVETEDDGIPRRKPRGRQKGKVPEEATT